LPARIPTWSLFVTMRDFVKFLTRPSRLRGPNEDAARHARDVNTRYNQQGRTTNLACCQGALSLQSLVPSNLPSLRVADV
jgi:hypothetical protein